MTRARSQDKAQTREVELPPTAVLEVAARERLDPTVYDYFAGGAGSERCLLEVEDAWSRWWLRPRVLRDVGDVSTATTVLGEPIALPVITAPTAVNGLAHPLGEVAVARGVLEAGSLQVVSSGSTATIEDVAAVGGRVWFQLYTRPEWGETLARVRRAEAAGASAIVVTVDLPELGLRARGPRVPDPRDTAHAPLLGDRLGQVNAGLDWSTIARLAEATRLPLVLKGVLHPEDAHLAAEAGMAAVIVSNHGARQLDGELPSALALPDVVAAVAGRCEVYVDSGVRTGPDVLRALALGARAVLVGRPYIWALAVAGPTGVALLLDRLQRELRNAMALCGQVDAMAVEPSIVVPRRG